MGRSAAAVVGDVSEIGEGRVSEIVERVIVALRPRYLMIDAYGIEPPAKHISQARDTLAARSPHNGGASIRIDPDDLESVRLFVLYSPYSAGADVAHEGPSSTLVQIRDADIILLWLTSEERTATGLELESSLWRPLPVRPRRRWWPSRGVEPTPGGKRS